MSLSFRQRALMEMGFSPWTQRAGLAVSGGATPSFVVLPDADGAQVEVIDSPLRVRVPVASMAALGLAEMMPLMRSCMACERADTRRLVALPKGSPKAKLMVIEEVPGNESQVGDKMSAANQQRLFEQMLFSLDLTLSQVYTTHLVRCDGDVPSEDQIATCSGYLKREIELIEPRAIIAFGALAEAAVRGFDTQCEIFTLPHPSLLLGNGGTKKAAWLTLLAVKDLLAQSQY